MSSYQRISASTLRSWMESKPESIAVVDVRDSDHVGGHIRSSINVPSSEFRSNLPKLEQAVANRQRIVFHCQLSQQRGPSCAAAYCRHIAGGKSQNQEVFVLSGGFNEWAHKYGSDPRLTESFAKDLYL